MITIIFLDDDKQPVSISFTHDNTLTDVVYGKWNTDDNHVMLNDDGWDYLLKNRNNVRNLKPMLDKLNKIEGDTVMLTTCYHFETQYGKYWFLSKTLSN